MRFLQFFNLSKLKGIQTVGYKALVAVGVIVAIVSDSFTIVKEFVTGGPDKNEESNITATTQKDSMDILSEDTLHYTNATVQKSLTKSKPNKTSPVKTTSPTKPKAIEVNYFNKEESLLDASTMALFIKNSQNAIDRNLMQNLAQELQRNNINASISFFNQQSLQHYNSFYSANTQWVTKIQLPEYVNTYLIGRINEVISPSTIDSEITRVKLSFTGKLISIKNQTAIAVSADADESSYDAQEASKDAYSAIVSDILASVKTKI